MGQVPRCERCGALGSVGRRPGIGWIPVERKLRAYAAEVRGPIPVLKDVTLECLSDHDAVEQAVKRAHVLNWLRALIACPRGSDQGRPWPTTAGDSAQWLFTWKQASGTHSRAFLETKTHFVPKYRP